MGFGRGTEVRLTKFWEDNCRVFWVFYGQVLCCISEVLCCISVVLRCISVVLCCTSVVLCCISVVLMVVVNVGGSR